MASTNLGINESIKLLKTNIPQSHIDDVFRAAQFNNINEFRK